METTDENKVFSVAFFARFVMDQTPVIQSSLLNCMTRTVTFSRRALVGAVFFLLVLMLCATQTHAQSKIFDVTDFGAVSDGNECSAAFSAAWNTACQFKGNAGLVIPTGNFLLGPVDFGGPCNNNVSPFVNINGTLIALPDKKDFEDSWITFHDLDLLTVTGNGGILDGQGSSSWPQSNCHTDPSSKMPPTSLMFNNVSNSEVFGISLVNSKAFHLKFDMCNFINAHDINVTAPEDSPNTDGIHIGNTDHINVTNSKIGTGDDCISIGPGSTNVFISDVICGPGHGIIIGSLGKYQDEKDVNGVHVMKSIIMGTMNGLRIKTWPGSPASRAFNFTFEDVIMIDVSNPIIVDQEYCPANGCTDTPSQVEISNVVFNKIRGTSATDVAVNFACSRDVPCTDVVLNDIILVSLGGSSMTTSSCSNMKGTFSGLQIPDPCSTSD